MNWVDTRGAERAARVVIVSRRLDIGGTEKHIAQILPELRRRGIDASLFVLERGGALESPLAASGTPVFGPMFKKTVLFKRLRSAWHLFRHLRRHRPDIVHFFLPESYLVGSLASMFAGNKVHIMSRRSLANYQTRHPFLAPFERWLHSHTVVLLGNSRAVVGQLAQECSDLTKIGLIYNGVKRTPAISHDTRMKLRQDLGLSPDCLVLTIVANLIEYKGHRDLLDGLALVDDQLPQGWRLLIVGRDDGAGNLLKARAVANGINDHILWLGEHQDIDRFFSVADIAVLCSHEEGFSNSLIEAMAQGLPVIATAVGGNVDAVVHGETGLLVPVKAPKELGAAIVTLATESELRSRLGAAARSRAEDLFSVDVCGQRYMNLYTGMARVARMPVQSIIDPSTIARPSTTKTFSGSKHRRILHVIPDLGIGGAEMMLTQIITTQDLRQTEMMVVSLLPGGMYADQIRKAGGTIVELDFKSMGGMFSGIIKLARLIRAFRPDIVQGWMYYGDLAVLLALYLSRHRGNIQLFWGIRCSDMEFALYKIQLWLVVRACAMLSFLPDLVIANSTTGIKVHLAMGYRPKRLAVVPNGVDVTRFQPDPIARLSVRQELGIPEDAIVLAHVARVDPMKDHQTFLSAMADLPDYYALLIGAGTEQLSTTSSIRCLGLRIDMPRLYAAADFVVSSSAFGEGFSNVIAEGMACGLPTVSTDVGDAMAIIGDTGFVVRPRDANELAAAIRTLASESFAQKVARSARARARIIENFSLERSIEHFNEIYLGST